MAGKIWFITGISRGLGFALAEAALASGDQVIGTTRDGKVPEGLAAARLCVLALDIQDFDRAGDVVREAHALHGRLDVVVNNAGYGLLGSVESADAAAVQHVFEVNLFGPLAIIRAALPLLRAQASGHVVNISSIAAHAPTADSGIYAATKAAISALSVSLAQEVAPLGIWVTAVAPGSFRTDFLSEQSMRRTAQTIEDYAATSGRSTCFSAPTRSSGRAGGSIASKATSGNGRTSVQAPISPPEGDKMMTEYTNLAQIRAKQGKSDELGAALLALVAPSREEPGCIAYAVHRGLDDPDLWMVYEIWTSPAELEAHFALPHMQAFVARVPDLVAGELDLKGFSRKST